MTRFSSAYWAARPLQRFLLLSLGLYAGWLLIYGQWLEPDGRLDHALSVNIAAAAVAMLQGIGEVAGIAAREPNTVLMQGQPAVFVDDPCNGLVLYALFIGFIVAFPGPIRHKLWFVPVGVVAIYLLNVLRVAALALNHTYWYHTVDFNHHYTFQFVAYVSIFGLWMAWVRHFAEQPGLAQVSRA